MRSQFVYRLFVIVTIFVGTGCGLGPAPLDGRYAIDGQGNYVADDKSNGSGFEVVSLNITNELGSPSDVVVELARQKMSVLEKEMLDSEGLTRSDATLLISNIEFGRGTRSWERVREPSNQPEVPGLPRRRAADNVSQDKGKTSQIYVCSEPERFSYARRKIDFCLTLNLNENSDVIHGLLDMQIVGLQPNGEANTSPPRSLLQKFRLRKLSQKQSGDLL